MKEGTYVHEPEGTETPRSVKANSESTELTRVYEGTL